MAGMARTIQLDTPDNFLAVIRGLEEAQAHEVLIVNPRSSTRTVAGDSLCSEANQKSLAGIIIDDATRDSAFL